jgi:hypothetical protein
MSKWYVIKKTSVLTPEGLIKYRRSIYAGPFDYIHAAKEIAYRENYVNREREYNEEFSIGTEDEMSVSGITDIEKLGKGKVY